MIHKISESLLNICDSVNHYWIFILTTKKIKDSRNQWISTQPSSYQKISDSVNQFFALYSLLINQWFSEISHGFNKHLATTELWTTCMWVSVMIWMWSQGFSSVWIYSHFNRRNTAQLERNGQNNRHKQLFIINLCIVY